MTSGVPHATEPEQLHRLFADAANAGDVDGLAALYEDGAAYVDPSGGTASTQAERRATFEALLALGPQFELTTTKVHRAGDVALMSNTFSATFRLPGTTDDTVITGSTAEVARLQSNGTWLYLIDDPAFTA